MVKVSIELNRQTTLYLDIITNPNIFQEKVIPWCFENFELIKEYLPPSDQIGQVVDPHEALQQWIEKDPDGVFQMWIRFQSVSKL